MWDIACLPKRAEQPTVFLPVVVRSEPPIFLMIMHRWICVPEHSGQGRRPQPARHAAMTAWRGIASLVPNTLQVMGLGQHSASAGPMPKAGPHSPTDSIVVVHSVVAALGHTVAGAPEQPHPSVGCHQGDTPADVPRNLTTVPHHAAALCAAHTRREAAACIAEPLYTCTRSLSPTRHRPDHPMVPGYPCQASQCPLSDWTSSAALLSPRGPSPPATCIYNVAQCIFFRRMLIVYLVSLSDSILRSRGYPSPVLQQFKAICPVWS